MLGVNTGLIKSSVLDGILRYHDWNKAFHNVHFKVSRLTSKSGRNSIIFVIF